MNTTSHPHPSLTAEERRALPDSEFGIPATRAFPLMNAEHVRAAETYFRFAPPECKAELARRILKKACQFDVEVRSAMIRSWAAEEP